MEIIARLNYLRIAPRKVRLVADLIRGKSVQEARTVLSFTTKKSSEPILKLLKSAVDSAKSNFQTEESNLYVKKITVDGGPKFKRFFPRSRGMAYEIQKRTSHVTLILDELVKKTKKARRTKKKEEAVKPATEKVARQEKPKFIQRAEIAKPRKEKGIRRIFRRKSF